jgi:predicted transposase YbfD/YdcC
MKKDTVYCEKNQYLFACFLSIKDPRVRGRCTYPLINILIIVLCGLICGCDSWKALALFAKQRRRFLSQFIDLSAGIPSALTIARVFSLIAPSEFERCLEDWMGNICELLADDVIAIDGKTSRGSSHQRSNKPATHLVNAYHPRLSVALASKPTPDKSNEIKGIPILLKALAIEGAVITIDAMGCQKGIANLIRLRKAHYVLALKKNHKKLYKKVDSLFDKADKLNHKAMVYKQKYHHEYEHSRIEERTYTILPAMYLPNYTLLWKDLNLFIKLDSKRHLPNGEIQQATRFYLSSLPYKKALLSTQAIRQHWQVENGLHYRLDVGLNEDKCPIFRGHADKNLAIMRKIVLKLLHDENSCPDGIAMKRLKAALSTRYLKKVINY